jgi:hypothetical protein
MKSFLLIILTLTSVLGFALPRTQSEWVKEALVTPEETLSSEGSVRCEHPFLAAAYSKSTTVVAYGSDFEVAKKNVFLFCVKKRCESLSREISAALEDLQKLSDQDFSDYLRAWGQSDTQIKIALERRHLQLPPVPTCQTASQIETVFGGCYTAHLNVQCKSVE